MLVEKKACNNSRMLQNLKRGRNYYLTMISQYANSSVMYRLVLPLYHLMYSTRYVVLSSRRGAAQTSCPIAEYG